LRGLVAHCAQFEAELTLQGDAGCGGRGIGAFG
jgi:hypothetical protein